MLLEFFGKQDRFSVPPADGNCLRAPLRPPNQRGKGVLHQERRPVAFRGACCPFSALPRRFLPEEPLLQPFKLHRRLQQGAHTHRA